MARSGDDFGRIGAERDAAVDKDIASGREQRFSRRRRPSADTDIASGVHYQRSGRLQGVASKPGERQSGGVRQAGRDQFRLRFKHRFGPPLGDCLLSPFFAVLRTGLVAFASVEEVVGVARPRELHRQPFVLDFMGYRFPFVGIVVLVFWLRDVIHFVRLFLKSTCS